MAVGWQPLIVCDVPGTGADTSLPPCDFNAFMNLIKNGITDMILLSTLVVVVVLVIAGFTLLTSAGNTGKYEQAKGMLWSVVIGYLWILSAWLIVYTITSALINFDLFPSLLGPATTNPSP